MALSHSIVFCVLSAAICAYTDRHQKTRRFAFGFALFGGTFFVLNYLSAFYSELLGGHNVAYWPTAWGLPSAWFDGQPLELGLIVNHLATLIFALFGGIITQLLHQAPLEEQAQSNR